MKRFLSLLIVVLLASVGVAQAGMVVVSDTVPVQQTNFTSSVTVAKFDPNLYGGAPLLKVVFDLQGTVQGSAQFENIGPSPTGVDWGLQADLKLYRPGGVTDLIVLAIPAFLGHDDVTAYDGAADFLGTSGRTYAGLSSSAGDVHASPPPISDLALFTATVPGETITLPVTATASSFVTASSGNMLSLFQTSAGANVVIRYYYGIIPVPAALLLGVVGVGLVGVVVRRKK